MKLVLAMLIVALPVRVSAQGGEEGTTSEPSAEQPAPSTQPAFGPPSTKWGLDWSLVEETPTLGPARIGLGASGAILGIGAVLFGVSYIDNGPIFDVGVCLFGDDCPPPPEPSWQRPVRITGVVLMAGGGVGLIVSGVLLGVQKQRQRELQETHYGSPRRVQWDPARSRLVF